MVESWNIAYLYCTLIFKRWKLSVDHSEHGYKQVHGDPANSDTDTNTNMNPDMVHVHVHAHVRVLVKIQV
jgi:hypothetical protein